jgi:hypothetical protein
MAFNICSDEQQTCAQNFETDIYSVDIAKRYRRLRYGHRLPNETVTFLRKTIGEEHLLDIN